MTYFRTVKALFFPLGLALGLFWSAGPLTAQPPLTAEDPRIVAGWLSSLGDRREGSEEERQVFRALEAWFADQTLLHRGTFESFSEEHSFSQQVWFRVPGRLSGDLVVVAPTDGDNQAGLAWAIAWASSALRRTPGPSITFVFTGAERGREPVSGLGSRTFLQDFFPTEPVAVLYLDTREEALRLTAESGSFPSPIWMVQGLTEALQQQGLKPRLTGPAPSLFRLDLPARRNALQPWFERAFPALWISGGPTDPAVVTALEAFTDSLTEGIPNHWDRHWLAFDLGTWKVFWGQQTYLLVFLTVTALLIFGYALLGRRHRGSLVVLGQGLWQIPVLLAFLFLALVAGTEASQGLLELRRDPDLWMREPLWVGAFKALVAISLFLGIFLPFRRSPLSRDPEFYAQAALVWLGVMTLTSAAFELSFSFYFLWALVAASAFVALPSTGARLILLVVGPAWLFKAAYDVLGPQPDLELSRWTLVSPVAGNFVLAVLFFPFLLQVNAWHLGSRTHQDRNEGLRAAVQLFLWALASLAAGAVVLQGLPSAPAAPPSLETRDLAAEGQSSGGLWNHRIVRSTFLDRAVWTLEFSGTGIAEEVEWTVESDGPLTIYDCSFPVILDPQGDRARIVVGRQPSLPLVLRLTLPAATQARLSVRVVLDTPRMELVDLISLAPRGKP